jgi:hypothetical protein
MNRVQQGLGGALLVMLVIAMVVCTPAAQSQTDLENALRQLNGDAVKGYLQPMADFFGANLGAGYYHTASISSEGFHINIDIIGMGSLVKDENKTYTAKAPTGFTPATFKTATVFGEKGGSVTDQRTGLTYKGSGGIINTSIFPFAGPQITIGSVAGTQVIIRYLPVPTKSITNDAVPDATLFGGGIRHSVSQYLPVAPLDLAVGVFYTKLSLGDILDLKTISAGAQASKSFSILTLYGGLAWEKSTMSIQYTSSDPSAPPAVSIDLDGANSFRGTVGLQLSLAVLKLFVDANVGSVTNFAGGIGLGF